MARPLRPQIENGVYHVYNRGHEKRAIFRDDVDRGEFIRTLLKVRGLCRWSVLSYCLLPNHYHLVLRTPNPDLARGMRQLNSSYAQAFNRRHERVGHVFQGRYQSRLIQGDDHLAATIRYVVLNPVAAGFCDRPENWPWSGHREVVGLVRSRIVDVDECLTLLGPAGRDRLSRYRSLFADDSPAALPEARGGIVVGDAAYAEQVIAEASDPSIEVPKRQRLAGRPELDAIQAGDRADWLIAAYYEHGYSQREIAEHLDRHYATVSRWLREAEQARGMWQRKT
jgi:REP-associated tyrosine transposase